MSVRFEMRVDDALMEGIDAARGNETRAAWIKRALAAALGSIDGGAGDDHSSAPGSKPGRAPSAPRRAPVVGRDGPPDADAPLPKIARRHWA